MKSKELWSIFSKTGKITDYLKYKKCKKAKNHF